MTLNLLNLHAFIGWEFFWILVLYFQLRLSAQLVSQKVQRAVGYLTIPLSSKFGLKRAGLIVGIFLVDLFQDRHQRFGNEEFFRIGKGLKRKRFRIWFHGLIGLEGLLGLD